MTGAKGVHFKTITFVLEHCIKDSVAVAATHSDKRIYGFLLAEYLREIQMHRTLRSICHIS